MVVRVKRKRRYPRSGIYCILHVPSGRRYFGSSQDAKRRMFVAHRNMLRKGEHYNQWLQRTWNRDGEATFSFAIVEYCDRDKLQEREQLWLNTAVGEFNLSPTANNQTGFRFSEESKARMSAKRKDKPKSKAHRLAIGRGNKGKKRTIATRQLISEAVKIAMADPERRAKQAEYGAMAGAPFKGRHHTPEAKAALSQKKKAWWRAEYARQAQE